MSSNSMDVLNRGRQSLKSAGIDGFALDALVLLTFALKKPKEWLYSHDYALSAQEELEYFSAIEKRICGAPVKYIVNRCEFMGLDFYVDENVLIPRNDTEILAEKLLEASKKIRNPQILDLCTGSGCIGITAAYYNEEAIVTGTDISGEAVKISERNAKALGVSGRAKFYESSLFEIFKKNVQFKRFFDIIVSNPPYISKTEMDTLPEEVRREPELALLAGETGLEFYEAIAGEAGEYLKKGGVLLFETGYAQAECVAEIFNKNGYNNIEIHRDLAGLNRVVKGEI